MILQCKAHDSVENAILLKGYPNIKNGLPLNVNTFWENDVVFVVGIACLTLMHFPHPPSKASTTLGTVW
jgi:hypothetical protein